MGELHTRVKQLAQIIKDQRPHGVTQTYRALDDAWRTSTEIHARVLHCTASSTRRYLHDLKVMGLADYRMTECGSALWRRKLNGE